MQKRDLPPCANTDREGRLVVVDEACCGPLTLLFTGVDERLEEVRTREKLERNYPRIPFHQKAVSWFSLVCLPVVLV